MKTIASFGCGVDSVAGLLLSTMKLPLITMKGKDSKTLFECACFNG